MATIGWILMVLGVLSIILGLVYGVRDLFRRQNEGAAQGLLPQGFLEVLLKMLEAGPAKFFFVGGLILIVVGAGMTGFEIFTTETGDGGNST